MLIKLEVENFRSIKSRIVFHTIQRNYKRFTNHCFQINENLSILKTTGIYGPNASGKTNLLKSLYFVKKMVESPYFYSTFECGQIFFPFRLNNKSILEPSQFKIDFIISDKVYSYELIIQKGTGIINKEILCTINPELDDTAIIFERSFVNNESKVFFTNQPKEYTFIVNDFLLSDPSVLVLSLTFLSSPDIRQARRWFTDKLQILFPTDKLNNLTYILNSDQSYFELANKLVKFSQIGIDSLVIEKIPINVYLGSENEDQIKYITQQLDAKTPHYTFDDANENECTAIKENGEVFILKLSTIHLDNQGEFIKFDLKQESRGTLVVIQLLSALLLSHSEGINYFIDEINRSIHPILIRELLYQYLTNNIESAKGQLIFNSHEDILIDEKLFRQDEIWFVEKNDLNETQVFPLSNFPNVRHDLDLSKNYLEGKFGGVPFNEELDKLKFDE